MAEHDLTVAATYPQFNAGVAPWGNAGSGFGESTVLKFHIDIDELEETLGTIGSTDVLHLWDIPIGTEIRKVMIVTRHLDTAAGGVTVSCGDTDSAACFVAATALPAVSSVIGSAVTTDAYAIVGGRLYKAANILHLTFGTAVPAGAIFDVYVYCTMVDYL
jgi:hypothetical protein